MGCIFWLVVLGCCAITNLGPFLINLINGLMQLNSGADPLCCVLEWFVRP
jgi:hypothetical protein